MKLLSILSVLSLLALGFFLQEIDRQTIEGSAFQLPHYKMVQGNQGICTSKQSYADLPPSFEANKGQTEDPVRFLSRGSKHTLYLAPAEAVLEFYHSKSSASDKVRIRPEGGNVSPLMIGEEELPGVSHYFIGNDPKKWRTGIPHYARIRYKEIYPGIDLVFYGSKQQLEFDFIIVPGANLSAIVFALEGAKRLKLEKHGDLSVDLDCGKILLRRPYIYQGIRSKKVDIQGKYILLGGNRVGFEVPSYDPNQPLVIDPTLSYSTYFGKSDNEGCLSVAEDSAGNIYFCGFLNHLNFPTVNPYQPTFGGGSYDACVVKLNSAGNAIIYATYLGGTERDVGERVAVDNSGNAYLVGESTSPNFPLVNPIQSSMAGSNIGYGDAFVTKFNSDGSAILYSTFLGGNGDDMATDIVVDVSGDAYVSGVTDSSNFPTLNPFQANIAGSTDAFLAKLNASGSALVYSTYFGGTGQDVAIGYGRGAMAIDTTGCVYLTGFTNSRDLPIRKAFQSTFGGTGTGATIGDVFITKFNPSGSDLVYSTYLGGSDNERGFGIVVSPNGNVAVTGDTRSTNFPTANPYKAALSGKIDAFVTVLSPSGSTLIFSTYLGGSMEDLGKAIAVSPSNDVCIVGNTNSADFPVVSAIQDSFMGGERDVFVSVFSPDGKKLNFSTYLGGSGDDDAWGTGYNAAANIYVGGGTQSSDFPIVNPLQASYGGGGDVFISRIRMEPQGPVPKLTSLSPSSSDAGDPDFDLKLKGSNFLSGAVAVWDGSIRPTTFVSSTELTAVINSADLEAGKVVQVAVTNPGGGLSNALPFSIRNPAPMLTAISPNKALAGESDFLLTLTGSSFVPNSVVRWNSEDKATTYISGTTLKATIPAANLATGGDVQVTVNNPKPAGGSSDALSFKIADFAISASPSSVTVSPGLSAVYQVNLNPLFGSYDTAVSLSCSGKPSECTSSFSQASVTPGSNGATSTLTLVTKSSFTALIERFVGSIGHIPLKLELALLLMVLILLFLMRTLGSWGRRPLLAWVRIAAIACVFILLASCGGGDGGEKKMGGTPAGTYTITIAGKVGSLERTTTVTLIVK